MHDTRPNLLLSTVVTATVATVWCFIRLYVFRDAVAPLTFVLPLLVCVWAQRKWQLWLMAGLFAVATVAKTQWILPEAALTEEGDALLLASTLFNIIVGAIVVHAVMNLRESLEHKNAVISSQYSELEVQAEELLQQNEEIKSQNDELGEMNEEIESQAEEAAQQNEELMETNQRLSNREEILQVLLDSGRNPESVGSSLSTLCRSTLNIVGAPATLVVMLELDGDQLIPVAHASNQPETALPECWPQKGSIAEVVLQEDKTAYVSDLHQRPDLAEPWGEKGGIRSVLATPVRMARVSFGVLMVCGREESHWTEEQFRMVEWVAAQAGLVAESLRWQQLLKERTAELEQASRAKDNFLATLSHELRTPLTPILMTAAALRDDERLPEDVSEQITMMERNIALEARLIDDLLDLTRIAKGKLPLRPQLCDAHSLIALAMEIVRDEAQEKRLVLEREFNATKCGLMADPSRFQQVIWNLLRNAIKFTPPGGRVSIKTTDESDHQDGSKFRIEVMDTGIGINSDAIESIFQPFEQGRVGGDHRFGGLGLGLSIARAIVDLHHGSIRAQSPGSNQGTTFIVELPGATEPPVGITSSEGRGASSQDASAMLPDNASKTPLNILLVEDHKATLQVLSRLLVRHGYRVTAVSCVTEALGEAESQIFDLVISDLGLPDGSGNELMEKLRDQYGLQGIALTGYGMEGDVERSQKAGFVAHLIKPVDLNQLRRTITAVITAAPVAGIPKSMAV